MLCISHPCYCIFFFFSSRRRHTRLTCDWSSDVCSSDLKKDARAEPLGVEYCGWWPRGTRSPESELVARPVPKPERRSVGVILFPGDLASVVGGTCSTSDRQSAVIRADK